VSPLQRRALQVARDELRTGRGLRDLPAGERRSVEQLAAAIAVRVADALEDAAQRDPAVARALEELAAR
jgi:hypothetical protein